MIRGDRLVLAPEKPAAGGRMIARHEGQVVLVSGAVPGEEVEAEVERVQRGTVWARTVAVRRASPDRVPVAHDWTCGGDVLAFIRYERQLALKGEIIRDAFARIGRIALEAPPDVLASPPEGYRMRARLHRADGRLGFFREGTHEWCDAATTRQLLPASITALHRLQHALDAARLPVVEVELTENCPATERAVHLVLARGAHPAAAWRMPRVDEVAGVSCGTGGAAVTLWGEPRVSDTLQITTGGAAVSFTVMRHADAFFQGNRHLLVPLVEAVVDALPDGRVLDLYAGVGLFALAAAARGAVEATAVESERAAGRDLAENARPFRAALRVRRERVETFLAAERSSATRWDAVIVDPPRTGMTKDALRGTMALQAARLVYVSCDTATLARDARLLLDAGYRLTGVRAFDLFPNTAHVETLAIFDR